MWNLTSRSHAFSHGEAWEGVASQDAVVVVTLRMRRCISQGRPRWYSYSYPWPLAPALPGHGLTIVSCIISCSLKSVPRVTYVRKCACATPRPLVTRNGAAMQRALTSFFPVFLHFYTSICVIVACWLEMTRMKLTLSQISWGSMPPDPPRRLVNPPSLGLGTPWFHYIERYSGIQVYWCLALWSTVLHFTDDDIHHGPPPR